MLSAAARIEPGSSEIAAHLGLQRSLRKLTQLIEQGDAEHLPYIFAAWGLWAQNEQRALQWVKQIADPTKFSTVERQVILELAREVLPKTARSQARQLQPLSSRLNPFRRGQIDSQCFLHAFGGES